MNKLNKFYIYIRYLSAKNHILFEVDYINIDRCFTIYLYVDL